MEDSKLVFTPLSLASEESNRKVSHLFWRSTLRSVLGLHLAYTQRYQQHLQNRLNRMKVMREKGCNSSQANELEKKIEGGISTYEHILKQAVSSNRHLFVGSNSKILELVKNDDDNTQEQLLETIEKEICGVEEELKCAEEHCSQYERELFDKCTMQSVTASMDSYSTLAMEGLEQLMMMALKHRNIARQWFRLQMQKESQVDADFKRLDCLVFYDSTVWNEKVFASNLLYWNRCTNLQNFPPSDEEYEAIHRMNHKLKRNTMRFELDLLEAEKSNQETVAKISALKSEMKLLDDSLVVYNLPGYRVKF